MFLLASAGALFAHGSLRRSTPRAGERVAAPSALRLEFSEAAELSATRVTLTGPAGEVSLGALRYPSPDSSRVVVAAVPERLTPGTYTVAWQLTGRDGHPTRGRYTFTVVDTAGQGTLSDRSVQGSSVVGSGTAAGAPPQQHDTAAPPVERHPDSGAVIATAPAPDAFDVESPAYVALRWLGYVFLVAGIGAVVMARIAARTGSSSARHAVLRRLAALGLAAAWLGVAATLARLLAQSAAVHGSASALQPTLLGPLVGGSTWGHAWIVQLAGALVATAGFTVAVANHERAAGWRLAGIGASLAALGAGMGGHASAAEGASRMLLVAADTLHVLAAGAWVGGVMMLALAVLPRASAPDSANVVRSFSPWALAGAGTLAATGLVAALAHVAHPLTPWTTRYGRILLLKLALVALIVVLGALNWRRMAPAASRPAGSAALRRSVWLEAIVAIGVLAVTAVLVAVSPIE